MTRGRCVALASFTIARMVSVAPHKNCAAQTALLPVTHVSLLCCCVKADATQTKRRFPHFARSAPRAHLDIKEKPHGASATTAMQHLCKTLWPHLHSGRNDMWHVHRKIMATSAGRNRRRPSKGRTGTAWRGAWFLPGGALAGPLARTGRLHPTHTPHALRAALCCLYNAAHLHSTFSSHTCARHTPSRAAPKIPLMTP